jgi:hypothetical protein
VCVTICCGTLCYSFSFSNQTDPRRRDGGIEEGGIKDGEIGKGKIEEGGCEETFHCLIQTKETCRFTAPPAVALLNNISCGILWRIFCQIGTFRGVFSTYH